RASRGGSRAGPAARRSGRAPSALEQRDRVRREAFSPSGEAEPVGRRRTDVDLTPVDGLREPPPHLVAVRGDARLLADEHAVRVDERPARLTHTPVCLAQKLEAVGAPEALVARGEERPDVAETGGAEQR